MDTSLVLYNRGSFSVCFKDYEQGYFSKISINVVSNLIISFVHGSSGHVAGLFPPKKFPHPFNWGKILQCWFGWPQTHHVAQAGLYASFSYLASWILSKRFLYPNIKPLHWRNQSNRAKLRINKSGFNLSKAFLDDPRGRRKAHEMGGGRLS